MTKKQPRLKPCPFCGWKARLYKTTAGQGMTHYFVHGVGCWCCGAKVESVLGDTVALGMWNRRVQSKGKTLIKRVRRNDGRDDAKTK